MSICIRGFLLILFAISTSHVASITSVYADTAALQYQYVEAKRARLYSFMNKSSEIWKQLDAKRTRFSSDELTIRVLKETRPAEWAKNESALFSAKFLILKNTASSIFADIKVIDDSGVKTGS